VMDRLRSPGGCPWDAEQSHASLVPYLLEETYEAVEALEQGERGLVREELGDVLLQVVFHARVAQEHPQDPFDVDDVAAGLVAKLVGRHPHVFAADAGAAPARTAEDVERDWERLKAVEKGRSGALDGVPLALPALARAAKVLGRIDRAGLTGADRAAVLAPVGEPVADAALALVATARSDGVDPEGALRAALREIERRLRAVEGARRPVSRSRARSTRPPRPGSSGSPVSVSTSCWRSTRPGRPRSATTASTTGCRTCHPPARPVSPATWPTPRVRWTTSTTPTSRPRTRSTWRCCGPGSRRGPGPTTSSPSRPGTRC
jgi:XTP/dITP diphosphohydrolase